MLVPVPPQDYARLLKDCQDLYCETRLALMQARVWQCAERAAGACRRPAVLGVKRPALLRVAPWMLARPPLLACTPPTTGAGGGAHAAVCCAAAALAAALWLRLPHAGQLPGFEGVCLALLRVHAWPC